MSGTSQTLITAIHDALVPVMAELGWHVETARGDLSAIECLYRQGDQGLAVVKWRGAATYAQSRYALVTSQRFSVVLSARRPLGENALGQLTGNPNDTRLLDAADAARATLRNLVLPQMLWASPQDKYPVFGEETPLALPDGYPCDGVEQTWSAVCRDVDLEIESESNNNNEGE